MKPDVAHCRAGCARVCINPDLPCVNLAGYFHQREATRIARDLYAGVLAFEKDGRRLVILSCDLIAMTDDICLPAFTAAQTRYGLKREEFVACATHTHTGPEIRYRDNWPMPADYIPKVQQWLTEAVMGALDNMFDAVLATGLTEAPGLCHNRLSRCADGSEIFGGAPPGVRVVGPAGPQDNSVQTLAVYDLEKNLRAVAVNFACHPDLSGGGGATAVDSCWPGEMCDYLQRVHGSKVVPVFWQGTAGDINQADHRGGPHWLPQGRAKVARGVAGAALYALETATVLGDLRLDGRRRELEIPFYTRDERLLAHLETLKAKGDAASYFEKNQIERIEAWDKDGKTDRFGITCLRLGDIAIVALPGEIFTAWGLEIKRYSPARQTFVLELAGSDGATGYKASTDQCLRGARCKGAYGALPCLSQRHFPAAGQIMTETAIELLCELWPEEET